VTRGGPLRSRPSGDDPGGHFPLLRDLTTLDSIYWNRDIWEYEIGKVHTFLRTGQTSSL
jgi:hypothetical protein